MSPTLSLFADLLDFDLDLTLAPLFAAGRDTGYGKRGTWKMHPYGETVAVGAIVAERPQAEKLCDSDRISFLLRVRLAIQTDTFRPTVARTVPTEHPLFRHHRLSLTL